MKKNNSQFAIRNSAIHSDGFTLIELIIVIFIVGVISVMSITNYRKGERQRSAAFAADIVTNSIRNAQNFALTSRQISNSTCAEGKAPAAYVILFSTAQNIELYGVDKCDVAYLAESYPKPSQARIQSSGYKLNGLTVSSLQVKFNTPYAQITASNNNTANQGLFNSFNSATITVEAIDGTAARTVTVDGISGRIGE